MKKTTWSGFYIDKNGLSQYENGSYIYSDEEIRMFKKLDLPNQKTKKLLAKL